MKKRDSMMIAEKVPPFILQDYSGLNNPWVTGFMEGTRCTSDGFSPHVQTAQRCPGDYGITESYWREDASQRMTTSNSEIKIKAEAVCKVCAYRSHQA